MERKIFVLALALLASGLAAAAWNAVDTFESYSVGPVVAPWTTSTSGTGTLVNPAAIVPGQNLSYGVPAGAINDTYGLSRALPTSIAATDEVTMFLRFQADPAYANNNFGLTTAVTPNANNYNNFNVQVGPRNGKFSVRSGGTFYEYTYSANTWYDVWVVIHPTTTAGNFDVYMKVDGTGNATSADLLRAGNTYRNALGSVNTPGMTLGFFDALSQGSATNPVALMVQLDDISLSIPEPATMLLLGLGGLTMLRNRKR
jgi:hypothetical protein